MVSNRKNKRAGQSEECPYRLLKFGQDSQPSIKELVELSKSPKLENIQINYVYDKNSA